MNKLGCVEDIPYQVTGQCFNEIISNLNILQKQKFTFDATQGDLNEKYLSQISRMSIGINNDLSQKSRLSVLMSNAFASGYLTFLNNSMVIDNNLSQTSRSSMPMNITFANGNLNLQNNRSLSEENTQHYHPF